MQTKLIVRLINAFHISDGCVGNEVSEAHFEKFFVHFPADGAWKEKASLVLEQILANAPKVKKLKYYWSSDKSGSYVDGIFIFQERFLFGADGKTSEECLKLEKLLLQKWETPVEEKWVNLNSPGKLVCINYKSEICI